MKFLILVLAVFTSLSSYSKTITCTVSKNTAFLFESELRAVCSSGHYVSISGVGLGFYGQMSDNNSNEDKPVGIVVQCVAKAEPIGKYYGVKAVAGIVGNADLGLFASDAGFCTVVGAGLSISLGAAFNGAKLQIYR